MAAEDWFYDYEPDPWDDDEEGVTCKYCGTPELEWGETRQGWRLYDADGELHQCKRPKSNPADDFAPVPTTCRYTKLKSDGYGTNWKTDCDHTVRCEAPIEVGFSRDPLPNEDGKFCPYCGKLIEL